MSSIPSRGDYIFYLRELFTFIFSLIFFTFVLERSFVLNNIYSRFIFLNYLNTFNIIVLKTVSYIFLGVAMMRLEPAMKIEIIISFSRCLIRANVHIYLKPKETLHFELPNISLLFLSLTKLNIAVSCWYPPQPNSRKTS